MTALLDLARRAMVISLLLTCAMGTAHSEQNEIQIVPQSERALAAKKQMEGPTSNQGIKAVKPLGAIKLGGDFAALHDRQLRAREIIVEPNGVVAVHQHEQRPGVAYIIEGEMVEHRSDQSAPLVRKQGDVAFETSGVVHWWENKTALPARALVVDIVPIETK